MDNLPLNELHSFIIRAKAATYIGGGGESLPRRPGAHDLEFKEENFIYLDSYFGGADFLGQEVVYYLMRPVWAMNYYGRLLEPSMMTTADVVQILKESLSNLYRQGRFLGGFEFSTPLGIYHDTNDGDLTGFTGKEWIIKEDVKVYELNYHGGLIR